MTGSLLGWVFLGVFAALFTLPVRRACGTAANRGTVWSIAAGLAVATTSLAFFCTGLVFGPAPVPHATVEAVLLGLGAWACWRARTPTPSSRPGAGPRAPGVLPIGALAIGAVAGLALVRAALARPHGGWDAWGVWNLKARFLFREEAWQGAFSSVHPWSCPDYPLLLPGSVARLWTWAGHDASWMAAAVGVGFALATLVLLHAVASRTRGAWLGLLALVLYLGHAEAWLHGASQYADAPLAFFMLATLSLLVHHDRAETRTPSLLLLAGGLAGAAAWTKNEGILFAAVVLAVRGACALRATGGWRHVAWLGAGMAPGLATVAAFRVGLAPAGVHLSDAGSRMGKLLDPERYLVIARALGSELLWVGPGLLLAIAVWLLLSRGQEGVSRKRGAIPLALVLAGMLAGYLATYVVTPLDLRWHLHNSLDRLVFQLWPSAVLLVTLLAPDPSTWVETLPRLRAPRSPVGRQRA